MAIEKLLHTLKLFEKRGIIEGIKLIICLLTTLLRQALNKGGTWEDPLVIGNFGIKTEFVLVEGHILLSHAVSTSHLLQSAEDAVSFFIVTVCFLTIHPFTHPLPPSHLLSLSW